MVAKSKPQTVYSLSRPSRCHNCDKKLQIGELVKLQNEKDETKALCHTCANLSSLELVKKGNQKLTKLATKYSDPVYVVVQWSAMWKCYERVGILCQSSAIDKAEEESGEKLPQREPLS
jgi:hypothetical protein